MILAFILAQLLDTITFALLPEGAEANPFVNWLGPWAIPFKLFEIGFVLWATTIMPPRLALVILIFGILMGLLGAATNLRFLVSYASVAGHR
jgi:hypothetical protein